MIIKNSASERVAQIDSEKLFMGDKTLGLFQKTLLLTDGTVTDLLKLYTGDKIVVKKVHQEFTLSGEAEASFCQPETPILNREILLGTRADNYIYADSTYIFENLSRNIQYKLLETDCPIGLLWKAEKLETYREIIDIRSELCNEMAAYFNVQQDTPFLSRTYLIYHNHKALGRITEKFPITFFKGGDV